MIADCKQPKCSLLAPPVSTAATRSHTEVSGILTAVNTKTVSFGATKPYSLVDRPRRLGRTCCLWRKTTFSLHRSPFLYCNYSPFYYAVFTSFVVLITPTFLLHLFAPSPLSSALCRQPFLLRLSSWLYFFPRNRRPDFLKVFPRLLV